MTAALDNLTWPESRLGDALQALARRGGLEPRAAELPPEPSSPGADPAARARRVEELADWLGFEAEPVPLSHPQVAPFVRRVGVALLGIPDGDGMRFLAVLRGGRRALRVLDPELAVRGVDPDQVRDALCGHLERPWTGDLDRLLAEAGVPERGRPRAREAILQTRLADQRVDGCWVLRLTPGADFGRQVREARLPGRLATVVSAHALQHGLWIASWWMLGKGAFMGRLDPSWLLAWGLVLLTLVPLRMLQTWSQGVLAIGVGGLLKQRLLYGAMKLDRDRIRHEGCGQLLGRILEAQAVESLAVTGGFLTLVAAVEVVFAGVVLALGAGGLLQAGLLAAWLLLTAALGWLYYRRRGFWTDARLGMTHDLVERMVGHRTRTVQQAPEHWHDGEAQAFEAYTQRARSMDRCAAWLMAVVPRGWLVVGLLGLGPAFVLGASSPAALAVGIGGMILAYRALDRAVTGIAHLAGALIAWREVAPFFHAAATSETPGLPVAAANGEPGAGGAAPAVVEGRELSFRYPGRARSVLERCGLRVRRGDRILLQGPSGGGKSTLASLLVGLRTPDSGLLLLDGLDRQTLGGAGWRRRVVAAPQYHENHVLTGTFAFNVLMSRRWPPREDDVAEAEAVCRELGLGKLLERMPGGMLQMVGETGWRLSQGERSLLYIARALLQNAELVVLDESFASLDPETFRRALACACARARTLLVIAHP